MLHTFTDIRPLHSNTNDYFQIRASHDIPQFNVTEGDLGGYVQKISESVTHVHNLLGDSWVAQGCYVDNLSTLYDTLVTDNSKILDTDISDSTIVSSTIRESTVIRSDIISSYIEEHCHISKSTVTNTTLRTVGSRDSIIYLEDAYKAICDVKITEGRITESGQITSVFPIGTERQTATLYPHKDTSKPTVRIGCWHGALSRRACFRTMQNTSPRSTRQPL